MSIRKAAYALLNHSSITDLATGGIEPLIMPQEPSFPLVLYTIDTMPRKYTLEGCATKMSLFKAIVFGEDYLACEAIIDAIEARCGGYQGTIGEERIMSCLVINGEEGTLDPQNADGEAGALFSLPIEFEILHVTTV